MDNKEKMFKAMLTACIKTIGYETWDSMTTAEERCSLLKEFCEWAAGDCKAIEERSSEIKFRPTFTDDYRTGKEIAAEFMSRWGK